MYEPGQTGELTLKINTIMKVKKISKIPLIFGILSSLIMGCGDSGESKIITETFNYANSTQYIIRIQEWKQNTMNEFTIPPQQNLFFKIMLGVGSSCSINGNASGNSDCLLLYADSVKIIFDNTKFIQFDRNTNSNLNILKKENYSSENSNDKYNYEYSFSELHYNLAQDCNGSCD